MKKTRILVALFFICAILVVSSVQAVIIESIENTYLTTETVSVKSTSSLCLYGESVELYIVRAQETWEDGDPLNDVRGKAQDVPNSILYYHKIWENPEAGEYDIIIDCDGNRNYNQYSDPIDSFYEVGFTVTAIAGSVEASLGEKDVGNHTWAYDPEVPELSNEMLQLSLLANGENIELREIVIKASGTGNDTAIGLLEIYVDENNNGKVEEDEVVIGDSQPAYTENDGTTTILLDYTLTKDVTKDILIVYVMDETLTEGEFSLEIEALSGIGENSGEEIAFSGLPLISGTKTVLPEKTCLGELFLLLDPNPSLRGETVVASVGGLSGCEGREIVLRVNPCGSFIEEKIDYCILANGECEINFTAVENKTYNACIDKNGDGDMIDFGEYAFENLIVKAEIEVEEAVEEINVTIEEEVEEAEEVSEVVEEVEETAPITGAAIGEKLSEAGSFFILLEVTLLLILFVLVMILFRLRGPLPVQKEEAGAESTEKETKEEKE